MRSAEQEPLYNGNRLEIENSFQRRFYIKLVNTKMIVCQIYFYILGSYMLHSGIDWWNG
jgi:hypothetical protein